MKKNKIQGLIKNRLLIHWKKDIAGLYGKKTEGFWSMNIDGAQRVINNRTISSIEKAEFYDHEGNKTLVFLKPQKIFRARS